MFFSYIFSSFVFYDNPSICMICIRHNQPQGAKTLKMKSAMGKMRNTKEALAEWNTRTMTLWKQVDSTLFERHQSKCPKKSIFGLFVVFSARLPSDSNTCNAFLDDLFSFVDESSTTWDTLEAYLKEPRFLGSLAACAKLKIGAYFPCFDFFAEFTAPPSQLLLSDKEDAANVDEFERDEPEFKKKSLEVLGVTLDDKDDNIRCRGCQGKMGTHTPIQLRSADEGSAMVFLCGKKSCGLPTAYER